MDAVDLERSDRVGRVQLADSAFLLPPEVLVVPAAELNPALARSLISPDDYAVTRPTGRAPSCVVDRRFATLIEEFRTPKKIATAIFEFGRRNRIESSVLLDATLPLLARLVRARFLVPAEDYTRPGRRLHVDEWFGTLHVLGVLGIMEDTEVYKVRDLDDTAVLKIASVASGALVGPALAHEAAVLARLDDRYSPRLRTSAVTGERPYLVLSWCEGEPIVESAARMRESNRLADLRGLAVRMLDGFAHLHTLGVIHGDVHPGNVLCAREDRIAILDYGRAVLDNAPAPGVPRGGVGFYFEPEYVRSHGSVPATAAGEQYALAALVYRLLAGEQYLAFSLDRDKAFRQIEDEAPRTFASVGVPAWPAVETVLRRALAKRPEDRFDSVARFAAALRDAEPASVHRPARRTRTDDLRRFARAAMSSVGSNSPLAHRSREAPTASVAFGSAGIALACLRLSFAFDDPELLALADYWSSRAATDATAEGGLRCERLGVTTQMASTSALYGSSGVHAVGFLVAMAACDERTATERLDAFVSTARFDRDELDVVSGTSGLLVTVAMMLEASRYATTVDKDRLLALGDDACRMLWARLDRVGSLRANVEFAPLGAAHGWAGALYATLTWSRITGERPPHATSERLEQLARLREPSGSGSRYRMTLAPEQPVRFVPGWCAGSAGFVFMWTSAYAVFRDESFLALAREAAWHTWEAPAASNGLCCGDAGRAYALLRFFRFDGDERWLERAYDIAHRAVASGGTVETDPSGRGESLYKGALGIAVLAGEIARPSFARMPFYELDFSGSPHDAALA